MTVKDVLVATRELLADPVRWTQGCMAKDSEGTNVFPKAPEAVCWCLLGALHRIASGPESFYLHDTARRLVEKQSNGMVIGAFNDNATHNEVLAALDRAIATAE